jgi:hypothetical protein
MENIMRISRLLLAVCAAFVCAGFISVRAADNPAQAAARALLEQQLRAPETPASQTNTAPNTAPAVSQPPATPPPAAPVFTPATAPETEAEAAARMALEQKMREQDALEQPRTNDILVESNAVTVVVPSQSAPAPAVQTAPPPAVPAPSAAAPVGTAIMTAASPTAFAPDNEAQAAARAALEQNMGVFDQGGMTVQPAPSQTPSVLSTPLPGTSGRSDAGREPGFQPMMAPPLPISADKQAQLRALTAGYIANQITPEQYFNQRAQILAAP